MKMNCFCFVLGILGLFGQGMGQKMSYCSEGLKCLKDFSFGKQIQSFKQICSTMSKQGSCFSAVENDADCAKFKEDLGLAAIEADSNMLSEGCDGSCGEHYDTCLAPLVQIYNANSFTPSICSAVNKAYICVQSLHLNSCSKNISVIFNALAKNDKNLNFDDYCDKNGNPTGCFNSLTRCGANIAAINKNTDTKTVCRLVETYLECEGDSGDSCKGRLVDMKNKARNNLENEESKKHCPTVGSCSERATKCTVTAISQEGKLGTGTKNKDIWCSVIKSTNACIDFVRKDPICVVDVAGLTIAEKKFKMLEDKLCGDGSDGSNHVVSGTLLILAAAYTVLKNCLF